MDTFNAILVPAALGIVHVGEKAGLSERLSPVVSLVAALILAFLLDPRLAVWNTTALNGLLAGLAAYGFYSGATAVGNKVNAPDPAPAPAPSPAPESPVPHG